MRCELVSGCIHGRSAGGGSVGVLLVSGWVTGYTQGVYFFVVVLRHSKIHGVCGGGVCGGEFVGR